jgi:1-acyl-sn-glycerol-3-phosphate acyltransferase
MAETTAAGNSGKKQYFDYKAYALRRRLCRLAMHVAAFPLMARIHSVQGLENVPSSGPVILCYNHINLIDPFLALHVLKREVIPLAKIEVYSYPVVGIAPRLYGVIPVHRGEVDRRALQASLDVLGQNEMILVAPEGTRNDALIKGRPGTVFIAFHAGSPPVVPIGIDNTIGFPTFPFSRRWRQPGADITFGRPFRFRFGSKRPDREAMDRMTDEMMYTIAALLPAHRRGVYSDLSKATQDMIECL